MFDESVVDGGDGNTRIEKGLNIDEPIDAFFAAADPTSAVDNESQGSG